jgi:hypothetical protein
MTPGVPSVFAVLPDTLNQVRGDANEERPIPLADEE